MTPYLELSTYLLRSASKAKRCIKCPRMIIINN